MNSGRWRHSSKPQAGAPDATPPEAGYGAVVVPPVPGAGAGAVVEGVVVSSPVPSVPAGAVSVGAVGVTGSAGAGSVAAGSEVAGSVAAGSTTLVERLTLKAIAARITAASTRNTSHMLVCEDRDGGIREASVRGGRPGGRSVMTLSFLSQGRIGPLNREPGRMFRRAYSIGAPPVTAMVAPET